MYLTLDQVVLVRDAAKRRDDDLPIYEATLQVALGTDLAGTRVLLLAATIPGVEAGRYRDTLADARPYGWLYFDGGDRPCIIPETWSADDAAQARWVND